MWRSDKATFKAPKPTLGSQKRKVEDEDNSLGAPNSKRSTSTLAPAMPTIIDPTDDDQTTATPAPAPLAKRAHTPQHGKTEKHENADITTPFMQPTTPIARPEISTPSAVILTPHILTQDIISMRSSLPPSFWESSGTPEVTRMSAPPNLDTPSKPRGSTVDSTPLSLQKPCPIANATIDSTTTRLEARGSQPGKTALFSNTLLTPHATPSKPRSARPLSPEPLLHDIPESPARYTPKVSTSEGVEYVNPPKFCIKPPYWKRWSAKTYSDMADYVRNQIDPVPFARDHNMTVEEVQHVMTSLLINPLYDAKEAAKRGEEGIVEIFELANKYGTQARRWGRPRAKDGKRLTGELAEVQQGAVVLLVPTQPPREWLLKVEDMVEDDKEYLKRMLLKHQWQMLWPDKDPVDAGSAAVTTEEYHNGLG